MNIVGIGFLTRKIFISKRRDLLQSWKADRRFKNKSLGKLSKKTMEILYRSEREIKK